MGRRSRKRGGLSSQADTTIGEGADATGATAPSRAERDAERRRLAGGDKGGSTGARGSRARRGTRERPRAPWGRFPLTELVVVLALVLVVVGFFMQTMRGEIVLIVGLVLGSLAGLELALREHFAGYRSHTTLLAACPAFAAGAVMVLAVTGATARVLVPLVAVTVFAVAFYRLRGVFKRRSGGLGFR